MGLLVALILMLASPVPAKVTQQLLMCSGNCVSLGEYRRCWYELKPRCGRREAVCVDSDAIECAPLVVNLGPWDPVLMDYKPEYDGNFKELTTSIAESYEMKSK